ncbi:AraC family transcriptional regulator [Maribellus luteus]|uniref:AraC family transcriptional regulator n=1 Tax=Maribellus luteus TaxID=2305463 RepID=A0A399SVS0_9BACT|nr:AraC family transcriptional regulator [Maribellus luteus]RIJ46834.1 AraC family transcriptional regulator [Maribellus luteus]
MNLSVLILFIVFIIFFAFALILFYVAQSMNKKGLSYLYIAFFLKAIHVLPPVLASFDLNINYSVYINTAIKVSLLPLYYLYLVKLGQQNKSIRLIELWHFAPMAIELILGLAIAPNHAHEVIGRINFNDNSYMKLSIENNFYFNVLSISGKSFALVQCVVYSYLIYYNLYRKYRFKLKQQITNIGSNNLHWIKVAAFLFMAECLLVGLHLFGIYVNQYLYALTYMYLLFFGFYFFIHSILQPDLSFIDDEIDAKNTPKPSKEPDYPHRNREALEKFIHQFVQEKLYLQPELTLAGVAEAFNIPRYKITEMIKMSEYTNFYDLVNQHRVEHSIRLLETLPANHSLDSVGIASGFKSRSSFYRVFKNQVGKTPSSYISVPNSHLKN